MGDKDMYATMTQDREPTWNEIVSTLAEICGWDQKTIEIKQQQVIDKNQIIDNLNLTNADQLKKVKKYLRGIERIQFRKSISYIDGMIDRLEN
jgi:hypothetical protein